MSGAKYVRITGGSRKATMYDARWEERAEKLSFEALPNVRAAAEKWTGTVASVLAIFSIVALIKGPEDISKVEGSFLNARTVEWVGFLLALAVFCGVGATIRAAQAAYGLPGSFTFLGEEVRRLYREEATAAAQAP